MHPFLLIPDNETVEVIKTARNRILEEPPASRAVVAWRMDTALWALVHEDVMRWINDEKPDVRTVVRMLVRYREFHRMLAKLPKRRPAAKKLKKKDSKNAAGSLARRGNGTRRGAAKSRSAVARRSR